MAHTLHRGPRGGQYYLRKGQKVYVKPGKKPARGAKKYVKTVGKAQHWGDIKPYTVGERRELLEKCGPNCYFLPHEKRGKKAYPKYPICPKCVKHRCTCKPNCLGLRAAMIRARQYDKPKVFAAAKKAAATAKCDIGAKWTTFRRR